MNTLRKLALAALIFLGCGGLASALTNTMIAVSGTNIVLSWPSLGYESYLIQYRQTLSETDSWSTVTNAYPANGSTTSTFTLYGLVPPPNTAGGGGSPGA